MVRTLIINKTIKERVDHFKRTIAKCDSFDSLKIHKAWFADLLKSAQEADWTEEQLDDFGYEWTAKQLNFNDEIQLSKNETVEEVAPSLRWSKKGYEQRQSNKALFMQMCGL